MNSASVNSGNIQASDSEDIEIKVIACEKNDDGVERYKIKYVKYFWVEGDNLDEYEEAVADYVQKKNIGQLSEDVGCQTTDGEEKETSETKRRPKRKTTIPKKLVEPGQVTLSPAEAKGKDGRYYCSQCPKSFKRTFDFNMHQKSHSGTNPNYCKVCDAYFPRASKLTEHFRTNVHRRRTLEEGAAKGRDYHCCEHCEEVCDTSEQLQKHVKDMHSGEPASKISRKSIKSENKEDINEEDQLLVEPESKKSKPSEEDNSDAVDEDVVTGNEKVRAAKKTWSCDICNFRFSMQHKLHEHFSTRRHLTRASTIRDEYFCPECEAVFPSWSELNTHLEVEHEENEEYHCKKCDLSFDSKNRWASHLGTKKHLRDASDVFQATCCEKTFKTEKGCFNHERVHMRTSPYHCEPCDRYFLKKHHLSNHTASCHNCERPYVCPFCSRSYKTNNQLDAHLEAGHSFKCVTCSKELKSKPHLKEHLQESPDCVKYICVRCNNLEFETKEQLLKHKQDLHQSRGKKTFTCSECNKTYGEAFKLRQHMEWHSTGRYPFQCNQCDVVCYKRSKLNTHVLRVHLKVKEFECQTCGQDFKHKKDLDLHNAQEHEGKVYICPICDKALFSLKTFETHKLSHTKVNSLLNIHNGMKDQVLDFRNLTDLSMGLDSSEGLIKNKDGNEACKQTQAAEPVKIPSIMTYDHQALSETSSEDAVHMDVSQAVSVTTTDEQGAEAEDQEVVTPRFKIVTHNLSGGQPFTIKVAPTGGGTELSADSDTIEQLKSTLSDLLSVTLQEQSSSNQPEEIVDTTNSNEMIEIVLVPNTEQYEQMELTEEGETAASGVMEN